MMEDIRHGKTPNEAYEKNVGTYGRFSKEQGLSLIHISAEEAVRLQLRLQQPVSGRCDRGPQEHGRGPGCGSEHSGR